LKTSHGSMIAIDDGTAYFVWAVSYTQKMVMILTTGKLLGVTIETWGLYHKTYYGRNLQFP
jgi:hypothetical protein